MHTMPESAKYVTCRFCGARGRRVKGGLWRCSDASCVAGREAVTRRTFEGDAHQWGERSNG